MARVDFSPLRLHAEGRKDETVLDVARRAGAPIGNSCGGTGVCGRCRVRVIDGAESLSEPASQERRMAGEKKFSEDERLACLAVVRGDCSVTTDYWG